MKLSIITCTYNSEKYLQDCIDSVIAQNLDIDVYEHIFVDAKSKDNTKKIIDDYKKNFKNVRIIEREPKGVYNAMNEGIKEAKGDYILCLNSDDYLEKNVLGNYLEFIEKDLSIDLYYGKVSLIRNGKVIDTFNKNKLLYILGKIFFWFGGKALVNHPSVLLKRDVFLELGMFDETKKISSDYGFWLNMLVHHKKFKFYPYVISNFRIHDGSISSGGSLKKIMLEEDRYFQEKYLPRYKKWIAIIMNKIANIKGELVLGE